MSSEQEERKITPPTPTTTVTTQKTMSSELKEKVKNAIIEDSTKKDYELIMSVLPKGSQRDDCTVSFLNVESDI
jgi:ABC-type phosphate/phosphonate transport system substrate-binding protein